VRQEVEDAKVAWRPFLVAAAGAVVASLVFVVWLVTGLGGSWVSSKLVDNLGQLLAPVAAALACIRVARRRQGRLRWSWSLLGAAALSWGLGQLVWSYYELVAGREVPFPSLADLGYLLAIPLVAGSLLTHAATAERGVSHTRRVLDGLITAVAVLLVSWDTVLGPLFHAAAGPLFEQVLALAYPAGDVVTISLVIFLLAGSRSATRAPLLLVGAGLAGIALSDSLFAYLTQTGGYGTGDLVDAGWFAGYLLIMLGALVPERQRRTAAETRIPAGWTVALPYLPVLVGAALTAYRLATGSSLDGFLGMLGFILLMLVVARQLMAVLEHLALAREFESKVHQRTAELAHRERYFRSLVQNGSDLILVAGRDATIVYAGPSATRLLGLPAEDLAGTSLTSLLHPDNHQELAPTLVTAEARPGVTLAVDWRLRHADGSWRLLETLVTSQLNEAAVQGIVLNGRDITERKQLEDQLRDQALHDLLTGLPNRALFGDRLGQALAAQERRGGCVAVLFLDLDDFKSVNDTAGHQVGDALLEAVALRLRTSTRAADTVARLGGDEFAILAEALPDPQEATELAERIRQHLRQPLLVKGRELFVHASIGISVATVPGVPAEELLRNADVAMYVAKSEGKNRHRHFDHAMHQAVVDRMALQSELTRVIEDSQLTLHYQPVVDLASGQVTGVEALVRWVHPERGLVPPASFIPVAEQTGLIIVLGRWVLETACRQLQQWDQAGLGGGLELNVNVSVRQLREPGFAAATAAVLNQSGVRPDRLILEITESLLMENIDAILEVLHELRALGVRLAIDDFGTGYSSLAYLVKLPVHVLKIDRSFITHLDDDPNNATLVRSILKLARDLQLQTVAEGIEQAALVDTLRRLGCDKGQGYHFGRPLPAGELQELLSSPAAGTAQHLPAPHSV
jgi:diguanylate cyclase (GGDEF)-like protein/PAS domain S-box-containing protein